MPAKIEKIVVGTWVQRTRLHLSEIFDFLESADSNLNFDKKHLKELHKGLHIKPDTLKMNIANMDFVGFSNSDGVNCKIYEDGLVIINTDLLNNKSLKNIEETAKNIKNFYISKLSKAWEYLFSKGAPLPRELSHFEIVFPYFIVLNNANNKEIKDTFAAFGEEKYYDVATKDVQVYRGDKAYVINNLNCEINLIDKYIEEQIFMREYANLMHTYLNLHRHLWTEIDELRSLSKIKGSDVIKYKTILDKYSKTAILIEQRINQMPIYLSTRESLAKSDNDFMEKFSPLLSYKYRTLSANHDYIKGIWGITKNYLGQTQSALDTINSKITNNSINNLTIITATGAAGTIIGLFTRDLPKFQVRGLYYFAILMIVGYLAQRVLKLISKYKTYELTNDKLEKLDFKKFKEI